MIKAVLDTNVVVSGVIKEDGIPGQILKAFLEEDKFLSVTSLEILAEIASVLRYPKIRKRLGWSDEKIEIFLLRLILASTITEGQSRIEIIKDDPKDNKFINCALDGKVDYIVTGDVHLNQLGEYKRIKIITPRSFKEKIEANL